MCVFFFDFFFPKENEHLDSFFDGIINIVANVSRELE